VTNDDRKAPCSLRGDCEEIDGKAVCLCDLGFYGEVCEFIAFDGSGIALAFDGKDAAAQAEYPLSPIQLSRQRQAGLHDDALVPGAQAARRARAAPR
jgi:hypothetical protein